MAKKNQKGKKSKYLKIVPKVWGEEKWIVNRDYCGKILVLKKGIKGSYHCHKNKDETFYINKGKIALELGNKNLKSAKKSVLEQGESVHIPQNLFHRFVGLTDSEIIEFSTTHDDKDSFRKVNAGEILPPSKFEKMVNGFKDSRVLVIGDIMLDQYIFSQPQKISDEAPILIVLAQKSKNVLGGSANVCNNLKALNVNCSLIGTIGQDEDGTAIKRLLQDSSIPTEGIFSDKKITTKKIRIIAKNQQLIRLDYEQTEDIKKNLEDKIFKFFVKQTADFNVVVLSDYAKGFLTRDLTKKIINHCKKKNIKTIIDPAPKNTDYYSGATIITPNLLEAMKMTGIMDKNKVKEIGKSLQKKLNSDVVMTLGAEGMMVFEKNKTYKIKAVPKEVYDVSGAGDTVVATIAASLASNNKLLSACKLANIAGAIKVEKFGTATVSAKELVEELNS